MTRVAENEINENIKKSDFKILWATIVQTITILIALFVGGIKVIDGVKYYIKMEVVAEFKDDLNKSDKAQMIRDNEQDQKIEKIYNEVNNYHKNRQ